MPITTSAKKALRASKKKRVFNLRHKSAIEKAVKQFRVFIAENKKNEAAKMIPMIYKELDKAAKTGYLKPNNTSRTKSRIMAVLNKLS